jgi:ABC-type glycerol-3-phosphate transport system substrate-binding protein
VYERLVPHPYLKGPAGLRSYGGCHGWAIPKTCGDVPAARALVERLSSFEAHALDARGGTVCARVDAFAAVEPVDATDARRLEITRATVTDGLITYPPLPRFPAVEDAAWSAINAALRGELTPAQAATRMQSSAEGALARD